MGKLYGTVGRKDQQKGAPVPQAKKKKIAGQLKAIASHEQKKVDYPHPHDKQFAQKTIDNATKQLNKLQKRGG